MNNNIFAIAIDGPAGAGKSTVAKKIAQNLNIEYIDTGAMYRALTLKVLICSIDPLDTIKIVDLLKNTEIDFINNHIYLDGKIVDNEIRDNIINKNVSYVSQIKEVREEMLFIQQSMASKKSVVMDGRDIGSVVLPNAEFKFYITASVEERSRRRYLELQDKNEKNITLEKVTEDIIKRDEIDSSREFAPLIKANDAILIDTTDKTVEDSLNLITSYIKRGL